MQDAKDDHPTSIVAYGISTGWKSKGIWEMVNFDGAV
jgi:hypothetical protein